ncbi:hypothetical protein WDU94_005689 [Cyamophila willieti]
MPLLRPEQHGFVSKKSTSTNLLSFTNHINKVIEKRKQYDCVLTDYSKAFDKCNINILCAKLHAYGIDDPFLSWFYSYFSNRIQIVKIKTKFSTSNQKTYLSDPILVLSGCPQGGHLSGLAFNLYINDIHEFLSNEFWLYADDKKVGQIVNKSHDARNLQNTLDSLFEWCQINRMELNVSKCKVITFHRNKSPVIHQYTINNIPLERVNQIKDLGVTYNQELSYNEHYSNISRKAYKTLGFINRSSREFNDPKVFITLFFAFVRPILEYASSVWSPNYKKDISQIESVQHRFLRNLSFKQNKPMSYIDHDYTEILERNKISTLEHRRDINDLILLYKVFNNLTDLPELLEDLMFRVNGMNTRNKNLFSVKT